MLSTAKHEHKTILKTSTRKYLLLPNLLWMNAVLNTCFLFFSHTQSIQWYLIYHEHRLIPFDCHLRTQAHVPWPWRQKSTTSDPNQRVLNRVFLGKEIFLISYLERTISCWSAIRRYKQLRLNVAENTGETRYMPENPRNPHEARQFWRHTTSSREFRHFWRLVSPDTWKYCMIYTSALCSRKRQGPPVTMRGSSGIDVALIISVLETHT